ncbi:MAG: hypothetical protein Kow0075_01150 [Salibacteraceae bacterium]
MRKNIFIAIIALSVLVSCEEVIELDLPPTDPELVVEGYLVDLDFYLPDADIDCGGTIIPLSVIEFGASLAANFPIDSIEQVADYFPFNKVRLTLTDDYFSNRVNPPVSGAIVRLMKNGELVETLVEDSEEPGVYRIMHDPEVGAQYHLEIETDGNFYTTTPEIYESVPPLFGLDAFYRSNFALDSCAYYMGIQTFEREGLGDYYRWMFYMNNVYDDSPFSIAISDDQQFDGFCLFGIDVYGDELNLGDTLIVFQMHTSEGYYNFMNSLRNQTAFVGSPFDAPPAPIKGNVFNNTEQKPAFGYFAVGGITANALMVPDTIPSEPCP